MRLSKWSTCKLSMRRPQINNHHDFHQLDHWRKYASGLQTKNGSRIQHTKEKKKFLNENVTTHKKFDLKNPQHNENLSHSMKWIFQCFVIPNGYKHNKKRNQVHSSQTHTVRKSLERPYRKDLKSPFFVEALTQYIQHYSARTKKPKKVQTYHAGYHPLKYSILDLYYYHNLHIHQNQKHKFW